MTFRPVPVDGPLHTEIGGVIGAPRLVFVHGFTQTGRSWIPIARHFADTHEIVLVDAPGHGGSTSVRADLPHTADLLAAVGGRATYIGYSMGGRMVLHLALAHPEVVERLVLVSATGGIDDPVERAERRSGDESLARELERDGLDSFLDRWLSLPMFAGLAPDAADADDRRRNTVDGLASSLRLAGTGTQEPLWDAVRDITAPTLVMSGADDAKFTLLGDRLAEAIGATASRVTVPDAGHATHLERPVEMIAALDRFLVETRQVNE